ncbi:hypothetical protein B0T17DRAFT_555515 [Bombardia bombarda]|uniref:Capsule polysaccharide biosynthesis protein n=1 Tax=Bombardia bombarda TaxID=252184 RepID=A0AA40C925_9PEZI|nr:hypothetical protein B0T17DRAFT_555515 [Bombardia bombarda]
MASSVGTLSLFWPVFVPTGAAAIAYAGHCAYYVDWPAVVLDFLTGPGRTSRILLVLFLILNWKSLPLAWTVRVFHAFFYHILRRNASTPPLPPRALFHYSISSSRTSMLETDYNLHKSNSTYFADLDVSRSHLVTPLLGPAMPKLGDNATNRLILDKDGKLVKGGFGIGLGAVFCSFRKEISPLQGYEMWSRVLSWDRKWLYIVTHFIVKGKVRPTSWDGKKMGPLRSKVVKAKAKGHANGTAVVEEKSLSKYVFATAMSKYVFKLGRFTVHPAIVIEANGLLPERPGGWRGAEDECGGMEDLGPVDESDGAEWDWKRVEKARREGLVFAKNFAALDGTNDLFDGGEDGAIGSWPLG